MTYEEFYGSSYESMKNAEQQLLELIAQYPNADPEDVKSVVYCCSRLKSPKSMMKKLEKCGFSQTRHAALTEVFDAIGVRIVCAFTEDVYQMVTWLKEQSILDIVQEKDYIMYPKPNGYRSYHLLLKIQEGAGEGLLAEIQVRTIAIDFWATLEHRMKYKKDLPHEELIRSELKRCADEIASVDLSMQTIRDIIRTVNE